MQKLICPHCRGDAEYETVPEAQGRHGRARVRMSNISMLRCSYCGKAGVRYQEFVSDAVRVLEALVGVPAAGKAGLFRKYPACCSCRKPLLDAESEAVSCSGDLEIIDPPFHAELSILATVCPACGTRQLACQDETPGEEITRAVTNALRSVEGAVG